MMIATSRPRGLVDIVIDELGRVVSMTMRGSIHPTYDAQVLGAARDWKYKPATLNGKPVRYRRLIAINVQR
jgi:TonB family protein